jgi:hypothetical protein
MAQVIVIDGCISNVQCLTPARTGKASVVELFDESDGSGYSGESGFRRKKAAFMLPIDAVEAGVVEAGTVAGGKTGAAAGAKAGAAAGGKAGAAAGVKGGKETESDSSSESDEEGEGKEIEEFEEEEEEEEEDGTMNIKVQRTKKNKTVQKTVHVANNATVSDLKKAVARVYDIEPKDQNLYILQDNGVQIKQAFSDDDNMKLDTVLLTRSIVLTMKKGSVGSKSGNSGKSHKSRKPRPSESGGPKSDRRPMPAKSPKFRSHMSAAGGPNPRRVDAGSVKYEGRDVVTYKGRESVLWQDMLDTTVNFLAFSEADQQWFPITDIEATDEDDDVWRVTWGDNDENDRVKRADQVAVDDSDEVEAAATGRWVCFGFGFDLYCSVECT